MSKSGNDNPGVTNGIGPGGSNGRSSSVFDLGGNRNDSNTSSNAGSTTGYGNTVHLDGSGNFGSNTPAKGGGGTSKDTSKGMSYEDIEDALGTKIPDSIREQNSPADILETSATIQELGGEVNEDTFRDMGAQGEDSYMAGAVEDSLGVDIPPSISDGKNAEDLLNTAEKLDQMGFDSSDQGVWDEMAEKGEDNFFREAAEEQTGFESTKPDATAEDVLNKAAEQERNEVIKDSFTNDGATKNTDNTSHSAKDSNQNSGLNTDDTSDSSGSGGDSKNTDNQTKNSDSDNNSSGDTDSDTDNTDNQTKDSSLDNSNDTTTSGEDTSSEDTSSEDTSSENTSHEEGDQTQEQYDKNGGGTPDWIRQQMKADKSKTTPERKVRIGNVGSENTTPTNEARPRMDNEAKEKMEEYSSVGDPDSPEFSDKPLASDLGDPRQTGSPRNQNSTDPSPLDD